MEVSPIRIPDAHTSQCGSVSYLEMATQAPAYAFLISPLAVGTPRCGNVPTWSPKFTGIIDEITPTQK